MPRAKVNADAEPGAAPEVEGVSKTRHDKPRLTITLKDDGSPDVEAMKEGTREKVREFLRKPENLRAFGLSDAEAVEAQPIADDFVDSFYTALGQVNAVVFSLLPPRVPYAETKEIFTYTEQELALLRAPTKGSLEYLVKRFPWLFKAVECQDLIVCATLNYVLFSKKFRELKKAAAGKVASTVEGESTPPPEGPPEAILQ